jgi:hypothetical protein
MNLTQQQLAYIAGFLEGDGSFQIMRYNSKRSGHVYEYRISAYNTKEEVIKWFADTIGGYYGHVKSSPRWKKPFHWNIKNQEAIQLAQALHPYLISKKEEVSIWLEYAQNVIPNRTNKRTQETIDLRMNLIKKIRDLRNNKNCVRKEDIVEYCTISSNYYPTQIDLAYLAGLVDAEGCFRLHRLIKKNRLNPTYASVLEIGNTNALFFPWLMKTFGGNITFVKSKEPKRKNHAVWYIMASQIRLFIHDLVKYLIIKRPVCNQIIEFEQTILPNGGDRHSQKFKDSYKEVLIKRDLIFAQIQSLNTKGHH